MSASPPETETNAPAKRPRRGALAVVWWAFAGATCAGGLWAITFLVLFSFRELATAHRDIEGHTLGAALLLGTVSIVTGLVAGVFVGLLRGGDESGTAALALGMIGVLTGVIGGGLSAPAVVAFGEWLHPIIGSSLAWALAGLIAGLIGYEWSRWSHPPIEPADEDEAKAGTAPRVEWILYQEPRKLRDWPLFRVLPVLVVTAFVLVGAAILAPSDAALALAAVGVLGLAVALVMQVQEYRLRHLEARLRKLERRFRGAPDETFRSDFADASHRGFLSAWENVPSTQSKCGKDVNSTNRTRTASEAAILCVGVGIGVCRVRGRRVAECDVVDGCPNRSERGAARALTGCCNHNRADGGIRWSARQLGRRSPLPNLFSSPRSGFRRRRHGVLRWHTHNPHDDSAPRVAQPNREFDSPLVPRWVPRGRGRTPITRDTHTHCSG